jgi:hypothetical protein
MSVRLPDAEVTLCGTAVLLDADANLDADAKMAVSMETAKVPPCPAVPTSVPSNVVVTLAVATVTARVPDLLCEVAVIVVVPVATPVTSPVPETVAIPTFDDCHVAEFVTFCMVLSDILAVAVN